MSFGRCTRPRRILSSALEEESAHRESRCQPFESRFQTSCRTKTTEIFEAETVSAAEKSYLRKTPKYE